MNAEARALGLRNTHFVNPHGLDAEGHFSTAADLARIMAAALQSEPLRDIMGERRCTIRGAVFANHNKLLRTCPGVFAGKTGYTAAAGRCLVTACERDGLELVCVTLSDPDDWRDHAALYDWACGRYRAVGVRAGETVCELPVVSDRTGTVPLTTQEDLSVCVPRGTEVEARAALPPFAFAPVRAGERAGTLTLYADGRALASAGLVWAEEAPRGGADTSFRDLADRLLGIYRI